ncbi:hypothetical protein BD410DRAFT_785864 [Rickenella mellea]|uniref:Uncharacterized protein n=1 Tax=Rickenella mellea TaxID=50990 RepID=A0A4Y7QDB2_9AGAM|nr:hypothetical protein BD410DRAFT_785864 [Rickenella mellea]
MGLRTTNRTTNNYSKNVLDAWMKCLNDELRGGGGKCTLRMKQEYTILRSKANARVLLRSEVTTNNNVENV